MSVRKDEILEEFYHKILLVRDVYLLSSFSAKFTVKSFCLQESIVIPLNLSMVPWNIRFGSPIVALYLQNAFELANTQRLRDL